MSFLENGDNTYLSKFYLAVLIRDKKKHNLVPVQDKIGIKRGLSCPDIGQPFRKPKCFSCPDAGQIYYI